MKKYLIIFAVALVAACGPKAVDKLEREEASPELKAGLAEFIDSVKATLTPPIDWRTMVNVHSIMVVKDGKILTEQYFGDWNADRPHAMFSVSKTFTATAVGIAIHEGKMALTDKVADYFPDKQVEGNLCTATVEDLLMMAGGHDTDPTMQILEFDRTRFVSYIKEGAEVADAFFKHPFIHKPGSYFVYNSLGTYLLSAIVTKVTGESVLDYLTPRLFDPLGIEKPYWEADKYGITAGGWGLELKTEDMARMGQLLLQKGKWGRKQLIPAEWVEAMCAKHVECAPAGVRIEDSEKVTGVPDELNDWRQGYCYQMWRGTHGSFRADGAGGQYILLMPDKNAVVILTSWSSDLQRELNFVWKYIYANL